ncbi:hypothetical protein LWI29_014159 [Acer saccharum]|uniref:Uncharacterized protein n=1 Tax=Acer saccharum TaxID=4024 RepID=A0AA39SLC4_ACESA|nr:hypothetical protein LWI29_014159 [Acer saccharum]
MEDEAAGFQELENEAAALRDMQANVEKKMNPLHDHAAGGSSQLNREEVDSRSVFVGFIPWADLSSTPAFRASSTPAFGASSVPLSSFSFPTFSQSISVDYLF